MDGGGAGGAGESFNPMELVCGGCSDVSRAQMCPRHGADYLEYKCRYCCSVAVFFCFGTTHFCNACHEDFRHVTEMPKHALPKCPAGLFLFLLIFFLLLFSSTKNNYFNFCICFRPKRSSTGRRRMPASFGAPTDRRGVCPRLRDVSKRPHILMVGNFFIILGYSRKEIKCPSHFDTTGPLRKKGQKRNQ